MNPTIDRGLSWLLFKHRVTGRQQLALSVSYAGMLLMFGSAISYAVYLLFSGTEVERPGATLAAQAGMTGPMSTILMGALILGVPFTAWVAGTLLALMRVWLLTKWR